MQTYLELTDIEKLENVATCLRDKLLIHLLFHLGCRVSEALSLTVDDIDLNQSTITILHLKSRAKIMCPVCRTRASRSDVFCSGCGNKIIDVQILQQEYHKRRVLPLDAGTLSMLQEYIDRGGSIVRDGVQFLFGIHRFRAWQIVSECAERAGLPQLINPESGKVHHISPHKLRDAFAVHAVKANDSGDGLRLLKEHLGHTSFNTTKVAGEEHRRWYDRLWMDHTPGDRDG